MVVVVGGGKLASFYDGGGDGGFGGHVYGCSGVGGVDGTAGAPWW